jgi:hypothetical protein
LHAKRWSGVGTINLWNRSIKILWDRSEKTQTETNGNVKHVLFHNIPEDFDPDEFGDILSECVGSHEIVSIRPMISDWLVEFTDAAAAFSVFQNLGNRAFGNQKAVTEWVTSDRLKVMSSFADFVFELRNMCIANYWDPPIFIYGRILSFSKTQSVGVIIKNNRKNQFITFLIEVFYEGLTDIHARVCEILFLFFMEYLDMPKKNFVIECSKTFAFVGKFQSTWISHPDLRRFHFSWSHQ